MKSLCKSIILFVFFRISLLAQDGEWKFYEAEYNHIPMFSVNVIKIDSHGRKWFGTDDGLAVQDGENWTQYFVKQGVLPMLKIYDLEFDDFGNTWVGTNDGLYKFDGSNWTIFDTWKPNQVVNTILSLAYDRKGTLWIGGESDGPISSLEVSTSTWTNYEVNTEFILSLVYDISTAIDGKILFGTNVGMLVYDYENWSQHYTLSEYQNRTHLVYSIAVENDSTIWMGTNEGLDFYNWVTWNNFKGYNAAQTINAIAIDSINNKWLATETGLVKYDGIGWFVYTRNNSGLSHDFVLSLYFDDNEKLWIGQVGFGVSTFDGTNWENFYSSNGLPPSLSLPASLEIDSKNNIWVGSGVGLFKYDGKEWQTYTRANSGIPYNHVNSILEDNDGNIWVGTRFGLGVLDSNNIWTIFNTENSPNKDDIYWLKKDSNGAIYIISANQFGNERELFKYSSSNWETVTIESLGISNSEIMQLEIDNHDNVWILTPQNGLLKFDGTNWQIFNEFDFSLAYNLSCIAPGEDDYIYIGTKTNGIIKFNGSETTYINSSNSDLPVNFIRSLLFTEENVLWIGFDYGWGIAKYTQDSIKTYNTTTSPYVPGVAADQIKKDHNGNLWITAFGLGVACFNENSITSIESSSFVIPNSLGIYQNYPNPFNPQTTIRYQLNKSSGVSVETFDILGKLVTRYYQGKKSPGIYEYRFDGSTLASGVYICRVVTDYDSKSIKLVLSK